MPRWTKEPPEGASRVGDGLVATIEKYVKWMEVRGYAEESVLRRRVLLHGFTAWCQERSIERPKEVTQEVLERYRVWLHEYRKRNGNPLSVATQNTSIWVLRGYFRWLTKERLMESNPAMDLEGMKQPRRLPRAILSVQEVEEVLRQPDVEMAKGLRDRAMLETFYATGIRRMELGRLKMPDVDFERKTVMVWEGKGKKDRMIPISERALMWIDRYLQEARPALVTGGEDALFVSRFGRALRLKAVSEIVTKYVRKAGSEKKGSCHMFRHTMATLMLENGADVRFIQQMLGHERLETTQIYTQVTVGKLQEVYERTHPGAGVNSARDEEANAPQGAGADAEKANG